MQGALVLEPIAGRHVCNEDVAVSNEDMTRQQDWSGLRCEENVNVVNIAVIYQLLRAQGNAKV